MRGLVCKLFGHRPVVRQPISFIPFDQGGLECARCFVTLPYADYEEVGGVIRKKGEIL
jgi:hypothetical protein